MSADYLLLGSEGGGVVYVTGHRHPDTDSIVSAIGYAYLRQMQGYNVVACRLGEITPETRYLIERFNQSEPLLLTDARSQLDESIMDDANAIPEDAILKDVIERFDEKRKVFTIQDEKRRLLGLVTNSSIGEVVWGDTAKSIDLLSKTSVENITRSIDGKILYAPAEDRHNGKVSIVALSANNLKFYDVAGRIVILGNDTNAQIEAIRKKAAILILVWTKEVAPMVMQEAKKYKCAIILSGHGTMNTSRYIYYSIPVKYVMTKDLIVFSDQEFIEDARDKMLRTRHRAYPIVDEENRVMGMTSRYRLLNAPSRRFVLVDHNESKQSVPNIDKAEVVEIIDHHRLGDITSDKPITFRNEPLGATATIVSKLYLEQEVEPSKDIAGLLLSAIIADTLNFKSPTTTSQDKKIAEHWSQFTGLKMEELAADIFMESSKHMLEDLEQLIHGDVKEYQIADRLIVISQHTMYRLNEAAAVTDEVSDKLQKAVKESGAYLWIMMFTSARDSGSIFYAEGPGKDSVQVIFPNKDNEEHTFQTGIVSRKNQVVPKLFKYLRDGSII